LVELKHTPFIGFKTLISNLLVILHIIINQNSLEGEKMSLFKANIIKEGRKTVSKDVLLNNKRVSDFWQNTSGKTVFYYKDLQKDGTMSPVEMVYNGNSAQFKVLVEEEDSTVDFLKLKFTKYISKPRERYGNETAPLATYHNINIDQILRVDEKDSNESYISWDRGDFKVVKVLVPYNLDTINGGTSGSGSVLP
jgi:hypothetical protein